MALPDVTTSLDDRIYYQDQTGWTPVDFQGLWRYLNRLFQHIGPTLAQVAAPEHWSSQIQARRSGRRDAELAALDLSRMSTATQYLMKHMLIAMDRYSLALERFPNLRGLEEVRELDQPLVLDDEPSGAHPYLTQAGIII